METNSARKKYVSKELNTASVFIGIHVWLKLAVDCVTYVAVPVDVLSTEGIETKLRIFNALVHCELLWGKCSSS